jgi:hypothetical protein
MITLDERAAAAAADLLERAHRRPLPTVDELVRPRRRARAPLAIAAAAALVLLAVGVGLSRGEHERRAIPSVSVPDGVQPRTVSATRFGISVEVPDTWTAQPGGPVFGFAWRGADDDAYVGVTRVAGVRGLDIDGFADARSDLLRSYGADITNRDGVDVGEKDAIELRYSLPRQSDAGHDSIVTELDIDLGDGTFAVVDVGEAAPEDQRQLRAWIASTVTASAPESIDPKLVHPTSIAPPPGVVPKSVTEDAIGFSIDVPDTWVGMTPPGAFTFGMRAPDGPGQVIAMRLPASAARTAAREASLRSAGADITQTLDTTIDGHAATVRRYWLRTDHLASPQTTPGSSSFALVITEYVIDLGGGDDAVVAFSTSGRTPADLFDWVRSTLRVP